MSQKISKLGSLDVKVAVFELRRQLMACHDFLNHTHWWLLGTTDCHLCEKAEELLLLASTSYRLPSIQKVEILELQEPYLSQVAIQIPVLITHHRKLCYPFGLMDIIACLDF